MTVSLLSTRRIVAEVRAIISPFEVFLEHDVAADIFVMLQPLRHEGDAGHVANMQFDIRGAYILRHSAAAGEYRSMHCRFDT
jgi:hypothetical protein